MVIIYELRKAEKLGILCSATIHVQELKQELEQRERDVPVQMVPQQQQQQL